MSRIGKEVVPACLVMLVLLTGCSKTEASPMNSLIDVEQTMVNSQNEYLEDYDLLWKELEVNYPFWFALGEEVDVENIREEYRSLLVNNVNTLQEFYDLLSLMLSEVTRSTSRGTAAHLGVLTKDDYSIYSSLYEKKILVMILLKSRLAYSLMNEQSSAMHKWMV